MKKILLILIFLLYSSNISFAADTVNVYYFYSKPRCVTCSKIENFTKSAVESMNDKTVIFRSIDMQKPENEKLVKKYKLFTKSVVISKNKNGKESWKNLDKVWMKTGKEQEFKKYVINEIQILKGIK